jgi:hypothetical protein
VGRLKVHGGDFAKGRAWFTPKVGFLLRNMNGERESLLVGSLVVTYDATEASIRKLGGDELLVEELGNVPASDKAGQHLFIL